MGSNFAVHSEADFRCPHAGDGETVDGSAEDYFPRWNPATDSGTDCRHTSSTGCGGTGRGFQVFSPDRVQQRSGEQIIETATLSLAENVVEMPVAQTQEKMQQVGNMYVQHVARTVEVVRSKIIKQTVQKPVIQEKINQVIKHIEIPQNQLIDKVVDMLDAVQRHVSMV